jgi:archaetidylinositol phosphate synthase
MLTRLKQKVQGMLTQEARIAHTIGLTPNKITIIGAIFAFLSAITYAEWRGQPLYLLAAAILLLFSGFSDALDGIVARLYQQSTVFGGFLDSLLDRYADAVVYIGLILARPRLCDTFWGLTALTGSVLVSYSRARAEAVGTKMESVGFAERAERILILILVSLIAVFWQPQTIINIGIIVLAIISNLTVIQRSLYAYRQMKKKSEG